MTLPNNDINSLARTDFKVYLLLGLIVFAGFFLRVYKLDSYGIFLDEKYTMVISQGVVMEGANQKDVFSKPTFTPQEFWKSKTLADYFEANTRGDIGNSPAYYLILHNWMDVFGISDFSARFPSVVFSTLIIILLFLFVKANFNSNNLAILASSIAMIEPLFIGYSHQARNYSMSFFLTLLATHLFLKIIRNEDNGKFDFKTYLFYALTGALCLLSHFLTFTVFIGHGLYVLLFLRKTRGWIALSISIAVAVGAMALWMTYGGGQYTLSTLQDQADLYRKMAIEHPYDNPFMTILPATLQNVFVKSVPMFSDLFIFTNGLHERLEGKRTVVLSLFVGLLITLIYHFSPKNQVIKKYDWAIVVALLGFSALFYATNKVSFIILSVSVLLFYFIANYVLRAGKSHKPMVWFMVIMALTPNLFLVVWAFRNGHTYGLTQRYGGFSFPYSIILVSLALQELFVAKSKIKYVVGAVLICQVYFVMVILNNIYHDRSPKYNYFSIPRRANPHYEAAQILKRNYQIGDTIKYPSKKMVFLREMDRTHFSHSLEDAQLTNLYLPKDATYIQKMDTTQTDKILLVKGKSGKQITVYNFEGTKYRY